MIAPTGSVICSSNTLHLFTEMSKFTCYLEVPNYEALGVHYYFHFISFNCAPLRKTVAKRRWRQGIKKIGDRMLSSSSHLELTTKHSPLLHSPLLPHLLL